MTTHTIHLNPSDVPAHFLTSLGYTGRKLRLETAITYHLPAEDGLWSGGSRTTHEALLLQTGEHRSLSDTFSAPWDPDRRSRSFPIPKGIAIVRHTIFQGKDLGLTFTIHPDDLTPLLPPSTTTIPLTPVQLLVLYATRHYKASYNGKDRYDLIASDYCYGVPNKNPDFPRQMPTRPAWNEAKSELIDLKLLNKAGAITTKGRNAAQ